MQNRQTVFRQVFFVRKDIFVIFTIAPTYVTAFLPPCVSSLPHRSGTAIPQQQRPLPLPQRRKAGENYLLPGHQSLTPPATAKLTQSPHSAALAAAPVTFLPTHELRQPTPPKSRQHKRQRTPAVAVVSRKQRSTQPPHRPPLPSPLSAKH